LRVFLRVLDFAADLDLKLKKKKKVFNQLLGLLWKLVRNYGEKSPPKNKIWRKKSRI